MVHFIKNIFLCLAFGCALASCSETVEQDDEFMNWKSKNDTYFKSMYEKADSAIQNGCKDWIIIRNWSLLEPFGEKKENNIVVKVLDEKGDGIVPIYTDSVTIDIKETLIPTDNSCWGKVIYSSFAGSDRNLQMDLPITISADGKLKGYTLDGLSTALQKMKVGERWLVCVPSNLAYGSQSVASPFIPAFSTVLLDITLLAVKH